MGGLVGRESPVVFLRTNRRIWVNRQSHTIAVAALLAAVGLMQAGSDFKICDSAACFRIGQAPAQPFAGHNGRLSHGKHPAP